MKITPDDPRLTAYALDELDEAERKAIATDVEISDVCRREIEGIAQTGALLSAELAAEPLPQLTYAQQLAIEAKLKPDSGRTESRKRFPIGALIKGRSPIRRRRNTRSNAIPPANYWDCSRSFRKTNRKSSV